MVAGVIACGNVGGLPWKQPPADHMRHVAAPPAGGQFWPGEGYGPAYGNPGGYADAGPINGGAVGPSGVDAFGFGPGGFGFGGGFVGGPFLGGPGTVQIASVQQAPNGAALPSQPIIMVPGGGGGAPGKGGGVASGGGGGQGTPVPEAGSLWLMLSALVVCMGGVRAARMRRRG